MPSENLPPVIRGLLNREAYPKSSQPQSVELVETHVSWVFLADDFAYKIKKPVRFGFLDFSTLELRKRYCDEELRINRRYSADLYLEVVSVTGSPDHPCLEGSGPTIDYAVKMRRFPTDCLFDHLLAAQRLLPEHVRQLAEALSAFHKAQPRDKEGNQSDRFDQVLRNVEGNFATIKGLLSDIRDLAELSMLHDWSEHEFNRREPVLISRAAQGFIRECHGDLHLGNIVWLDGRARFFDGIEFSADLRWIDTMNEAAFPLMDLEVRGAQALAFHFLNRYLELMGDYQGIALLDYYRLYRAMVRAKVAILRSTQTINTSEEAACQANYRRYIGYALALINRPAPQLIITHGISGSGKSHLASQLAASMPAIWIRTDVERKRLFGNAPDTTQVKPSALYSVEMTGVTYHHLLDNARKILDGGYSVILDGTFLKRQQRQAASGLARAKQARFWILDFQAPIDFLKARVRCRALEGVDPSDANESVVNLQANSAEPLGPDEMGHVLVIDATIEPNFQRLMQRIAQNSQKSVDATGS